MSKRSVDNLDIASECLNLDVFAKYVLSTVDVVEGLCSSRKFLLGEECFCACLVLPSGLWKKHDLTVKRLWLC